VRELWQTSLVLQGPESTEAKPKAKQGRKPSEDPFISQLAWSTDDSKVGDPPPPTLHPTPPHPPPPLHTPLHPTPLCEGYLSPPYPPYARLLAAMLALSGLSVVAVASAFVNTASPLHCCKRVFKAQ